MFTSALVASALQLRLARAEEVAPVPKFDPKVDTGEFRWIDVTPAGWQDDQGRMIRALWVQVPVLDPGSKN